MASIADVRKTAKEHPFDFVDTFNKLDMKANDFEEKYAEFPPTICIDSSKDNYRDKTGRLTIEYKRSATLIVVKCK